MKEKTNIEKMIGQTIHDVDPKAKVILFGSRARGEARHDSDWDVLILVDTPSVSMRQFQTLSYDLWVKGLELGQEINPIIYTKQQWENSQPTLFKHHIIEEGIAL
jgi:predicted nucleotidyltransferase